MTEKETLFERWLARRGPAIAEQLANERVRICRSATAHLAQAYPDLCDDPARLDRERFHETVLTRSPERLHALLQVVLGMATVRVIGNELEWFWGVAPRYGVNASQIQAMIGWYFDAAATYISLEPEDRPQLDELCRRMQDTIEQLAASHE